MRRSLIPGLLRTAERNYARRNLDLRLFETGAVYIPAQQQADETLPTEVLTLSLLLTGASQDSWFKKETAYDYFDIKGILEYITGILGIEQLDFAQAKVEFVRHGRFGPHRKFLKYGFGHRAQS